MKMLLFLYLLCSLGTAWSADSAVSSSSVTEAFSGVDDRPTIDLPQGRVVGLIVERQGYTYHGYRKIPFAQPPLGELRFKDPVPSKPWVDDLDGQQFASQCDQLTLNGNISIGQEDCLYLNVYTPPDAANASSPLPVMFFIHGGAYSIGNGSQHDGVNVMVDKDVIVVIIQYRLGIFGFLSTEDDVISGNMGLKDQTMALQWVHDNIHYFNGDTNRVTIYGESAGASSVHYHMMTPYSAGLFQGAIMQSGSSISPWALGREFKGVATESAEWFNCTTTSSEDILTCLQEVDHHLLCQLNDNFYEWRHSPFHFAPRIDGDYIPDHPARLMKIGQYNHVPVIMGINKDEGGLESGQMFLDPLITKSLNENFIKNGPASLMLHCDEEPINTSHKIYDFYLGGHDVTKEQIYNISQMLTHLSFAMPMDWTIQMMASQDPVYMYEFHYTGQMSYMKTYLGDFNIIDVEDFVSHADDMLYVFDYQLEHGKHLTKEDDLMVQHHFTTMWTNFAKTGNPTPDASLGYMWPTTNGNDRRHLRILPQPILQMDQRELARTFWEKLPLRINRIMNE